METRQKFEASFRLMAFTVFPSGNVCVLASFRLKDVDQTLRSEWSLPMFFKNEKNNLNNKICISCERSTGAIHVHYQASLFVHARIQRGEGTGGPEPLKNHKKI